MSEELEEVFKVLPVYNEIHGERRLRVLRLLIDWAQKEIVKELNENE